MRENDIFAQSGGANGGLVCGGEGGDAGKDRALQISVT